ncbi:hypothetical protein HY642_06835 [Candidatus Woesearchaeota archaeon]|nr:hypothetical protein [Candidatus Woesearchaeota archaeon]
MSECIAKAANFHERVGSFTGTRYSRFEFPYDKANGGHARIHSILRKHKIDPRGDNSWFKLVAQDRSPDIFPEGFFESGKVKIPDDVGDKLHVTDYSVPGTTIHYDITVCWRANFVYEGDNPITKHKYDGHFIEAYVAARKPLYLPRRGGFNSGTLTDLILGSRSKDVLKRTYEEFVPFWYSEQYEGKPNLPMDGLLKGYDPTHSHVMMNVMDPRRNKVRQAAHLLTDVMNVLGCSSGDFSEYDRLRDVAKKIRETKGRGVSKGYAKVLRAQRESVPSDHEIGHKIMKAEELVRNHLKVLGEELSAKSVNLLKAVSERFCADGLRDGVADMYAETGPYRLVDEATLEAWHENEWD